MAGKKFRVSPIDNDSMNLDEAALKDHEDQELQELINQELGEEEDFNSSSGNNDDKTFIKNVLDQKTVDMDEVRKNSQGEKKRVDFMKEDAVNSFTRSKSKESENKVNKDSFAGKSMSDVQEEIRLAEQNDANKYTPEDFREFAAMIMLFIDTIFSEVLKWFSGDKESDYSLPKPKKDRLEKSLTYILIKYQSKFPMGWVFVISLVMMYAPAVMNALEKRKKNKAKQVPVIPVDNNQVYQQYQQQHNQQHQQASTEYQDINQKTDSTVQDIEYEESHSTNNEVNDIIKKRKKGQGRKKKIH